MSVKPSTYIASLCTAMILSAGLSACQNTQPANKPTMPNHTSHAIDTSTQRHVKVGETFTLQLRSNPTTGYSWQLVEPLDKRHLEKVSNDYQADANPERMVGVGGTENWTFKAIQSGKAIIQMRYVRPWETQGTAAEVTQYQIEIK